MIESIDIAEKFEPIAMAVRSFAEDNGFLIEECVRGNSGWELNADHPAGGSLQLLLLYHPVHGLGICSTWQVPCLETALLYSHFRQIQLCEMNAESAVQALERELDAQRRVKYGHWTHLVPLENTAK